MLMTAVHHMDSSSAASPPPWLPVLAVHDDFTAATPASASSPATAPPPNSNHHYHHLLLPRAGAAAARRATRRRPRPSRRLPTTYISADPASFRRMVHQVTGADDPTIPQPHSAGGRQATLVRPAPVRADGGGASLLPTLDTSAAFLQVGAHAPCSSRTTTGTDGGDDGSALEVGRASCNNNNSAGFFPTLESSSSWDHHALF